MMARLIESHELAPLVRSLLFEADQPLTYTAGQFVSFTQHVGGKEITRAYSFASAHTGNNRFELCLNLVPDGNLSPYLFGMKPGDQIAMRPPLGTFGLRNGAREALFIATGTGIAPFRAMLQAHLNASSPAIALLFGVRYETTVLYRAEFEAMAVRFPQFLFCPVLSRPEPTWTGRRGHVQAHLDKAIGGRRELNVYLCGLKQMVDDVRLILKGMGFDRKQIFHEKYD